MLIPSSLYVLLIGAAVIISVSATAFIGIKFMRSVHKYMTVFFIALLILIATGSALYVHHFLSHKVYHIDSVEGKTSVKEKILIGDYLYTDKNKTTRIKTERGFCYVVNLLEEEFIIEKVVYGENKYSLPNEEYMIPSYSVQPVPIEGIDYFLDEPLPSTVSSNESFLIKYHLKKAYPL